MNGCRLGLYEPVQAVLRETFGMDTSGAAGKGRRRACTNSPLCSWFFM